MIAVTVEKGVVKANIAGDTFELLADLSSGLGGLAKSIISTFPEESQTKAKLLFLKQVAESLQVEPEEQVIIDLSKI